MKKFFSTILILFVLGKGIYLVIGLLNSNPPSPIITAEDKPLKVARGSYCWDGLFKSACADTVSPPLLIEHTSD